MGKLLLVLALAGSLLVADGKQLRQASASAQKRSTSHTRTTVLTHHVKLDVGLGTFEKQADAAILAGPLNATNLAALKGFDEKTRALLVNHTMTRLHESFVAAFGPLKKAIGKSWMSLPDDGRDAFVNGTKGNFEGVFDRYAHSFPRNGDIMMAALKEYPGKSLSLKHAEDALFGTFNKTTYRVEKTLVGYVDMNAKMVQFSEGPKGMSLIEVV